MSWFQWVFMMIGLAQTTVLTGAAVVILLAIAKPLPKPTSKEATDVTVSHA